jgi:hypothetical protein
MLPNQIGLEGDVTPPKFMAGAPLEPTSEPRVIFERFGVKIEKRRHRLGMETQVTVNFPEWAAGRRKFFDPAVDMFPTGVPALFVSFGRVFCSKRGWHARGDIIHTRVEYPGYVKLPLVGYKNPTNLANY